MKNIIVGLLVVAIMVSMVSVVSATELNYIPELKITFVNQDPDPAEPGKYVDIRWKVENLGQVDIDDVVIELVSKFPFSLDPDEDAVRELGTVYPVYRSERAFMIKYKVRVDTDAVDGENEIRVRFKGKDSDWITQIFDIDVERKDINFQIGSLQTEPIRLVSDTEDAELSVEIQNIGDGDAQNVLTELILPEGFKASYGYSDSSNLGSIEAESSKTAIYYIDVDEGVLEGEYDARIKIRYKEEDDDTNEYKTEYLDLKIPVKATPLFEIVKSEPMPLVIRQGDKVLLKLTIKNIGTEDAESVSVKAFKEASQPFEFDEKSDYVGKLKPGEEGEALLKFAVEDDAAAKTYLLDLEIRTINKEDVLVFEKTVPVKVSNGEENKLIGWVIGAIVALVIIFAVLFGMKSYRGAKRKRK